MAYETQNGILVPDKRVTGVGGFFGELFGSLVEWALPSTDTLEGAVNAIPNDEITLTRRGFGKGAVAGLAGILALVEGCKKSGGQHYVPQPAANSGQIPYNSSDGAIRLRNNGMYNAGRLVQMFSDPQAYVAWDDPDVLAFFNAVYTEAFKRQVPEEFVLLGNHPSGGTFNPNVRSDGTYLITVSANTIDGLLRQLIHESGHGTFMSLSGRGAISEGGAYMSVYSAAIAALGIQDVSEPTNHHLTQRLLDVDANPMIAYGVIRNEYFGDTQGPHAIGIVTVQLAIAADGNMAVAQEKIRNEEINPTHALDWARQHVGDGTAQVAVAAAEELSRQWRSAVLQANYIPPTARYLFQ